MTALVFGGAASGKSGWAEDLICTLPRTGPLIYLATMEDLAGWAPPAGSAVLLEDLGNLAANELFSGGAFDPEGAYRRIRRGLDRLSEGAGHLVVVSGDLFRDGVDYPPETGAYLDLLARLHRDLAARADRVTELVCGLPVHWKGGEV